MQKMPPKPKYTWDESQWVQDDEWWNPFNKIGRLKGKGTTSWTRAARRAAETPEERAERKRLRDEKKKQEQEAANSSKPLEQEAGAASSSKPLEQEAEPASSKKPLEQEAEPASSKKPLEQEAQPASSPKPLEQEAKQTYKEVLVAWKEREEKQNKQWVKKPNVQQEKQPPAEVKEEEWKLVEGKNNKKRQKEVKKKKEAESQAKGKVLEKDQQSKSLRRKTHQGYVPLGTSSSSSSSTGQVPEEVALKEKAPQPLRKVAVDWHNVIQIWSRQDGDYVPDSHVRALWDLQAEDFELISYAGQARGKEVEDWAKQLPLKFSEIIICRRKTGWGGKAQLAQEQGCEFIIDDDPDICWESFKKGLKVFPIKTWKQDHEWAGHYGLDTYWDLPGAVVDLVFT